MSPASTRSSRCCTVVSSLSSSTEADSTSTAVIARPLPPNQRCSGSQVVSRSDSSVFTTALTGLFPSCSLGSQVFSWLEPEPHEAVAGQGQQVRQVADGGERHQAGQLHRRPAVEPAQ